MSFPSVESLSSSCFWCSSLFLLSSSSPLPPTLLPHFPPSLSPLLPFCLSTLPLSPSPYRSPHSPLSLCCFRSTCLFEDSSFCLSSMADFPFAHPKNFGAHFLPCSSSRQEHSLFSILSSQLEITPFVIMFWMLPIWASSMEYWPSALVAVMCFRGVYWFTCFSSREGWACLGEGWACSVSKEGSTCSINYITGDAICDE